VASAGDTFSQSLVGLRERAKDISMSLSKLGFRPQPPSWPLVMARYNSIMTQIALLRYDLSVIAASAGSQALVVPTVPDFRPDNALRTKPIMELEAMQTQWLDRYHTSIWQIRGGDQIAAAAAAAATAAEPELAKVLPPKGLQAVADATAAAAAAGSADVEDVARTLVDTADHHNRAVAVLDSYCRDCMSSIPSSAVSIDPMRAGAAAAASSSSLLSSSQSSTAVTVQQQASALHDFLRVPFMGRRLRDES